MAFEDKAAIVSTVSSLHRKACLPSVTTSRVCKNDASAAQSFHAQFFCIIYYKHNVVKPVHYTGDKKITMCSAVVAISLVCYNYTYVAFAQSVLSSDMQQLSCMC